MLVFLSIWTYAQADSIQFSIPDSIVSHVQFKKLDSIEHSFTAQSDSVRQSYIQKKEKLGALKLRYLNRIDSLKNKTAIQFPGNPLDTLKPDLNVAQYKRKIDSLDQQVAYLNNKVTSRIDSLKGQVNHQIDKLKLPKETDAKIAKLTSQMDKLSVPAFDSDISDRLGLNNVGTSLPDMPQSGNLLPSNLPGTNSPAISPGMRGMDAKLPDLQGNIPSADINTGKIGDITGQAGDIQKQVTEAAGSTEALGKTLENKASEQIKGLPDQQLPGVEGLPGGIPKTGDEAKEQLAQLAQKEAINHFAGKEAVITSAMEKMSKYKQKYSSVNSLKDIKDEKRHNEMKGKPVRERLVPALTLQFQSWQDFMLDINPSVGYRFTSHFTGGIGWNQRVAFNISQTQFNKEAKVYGIRSYGEYTFKKGFGLRLDIESMNTPAKDIDPATDVVPPRDWIWGALIGVKQKYPIYEKLKGNAQMMYNIFDKDHSSPYIERINFRIGLEFTLKRKEKTDRSEKPVGLNRAN